MHWRTQELLTRHGPKALLAASIAFVVLLTVAGPEDTVMGYAEVTPVRVGSVESGRVAEVRVVPGQIVSEGEVVGLLDDGPLQGRMRVLRAELSRGGAELEGQERTAQTARALAEGDRAESSAQLKSTKERLRIAREQLVTREAQVAAGLTTRDSLIPLNAEIAELVGEVSRLQARLEAQTEVAARAVSGLSVGAEGPAPAVASQARAVGVLQEELGTLEERRLDLTLRAPQAARVAAVHYRVGEVAPALQVFAELLPLETTTVVACVPEMFGVRIEAGGAAELWPADGGAMRLGTVVDVSGLVSEAPDRCKQRPNEVGWVRPVRIQVDGAGLVPGQRFDVAFIPPEDAA